jgi:hypothetical protein
MKRRAWVALSLAAAVALALGTGPAGAERIQEENLVVSIKGGIVPKKLPRDHKAPVSVHLGGGVYTSDGSPIPRVNWIRLELAWRGKLDRHGLGICPPVRLDSTDSEQAIDACGPALVGHGKLYAEIFVPNQEPFGVHAHLLAFNGQTKAGRPAVLVHAYASNPPVSFLIPFSIHRQKGAFQTVLVTTIRRSVGPWPHVANFQIAVSRDFMYRGEKHSYLSASCPLPDFLTAGFLSSARATYSFAGGAQMSIESVRSCRAR